MGHLIDRCDFIDMLEESVTTGGKVAVSLHDGQHFVDQVNDVVTQEGQDWAVFAEHDWVKLNDIDDCARAEPREPTYDYKL
jgi:Rho-binding antiterminator